MKKIVIVGVIIGIVMFAASFIGGAYVGCRQGARAVINIQLECWNQLELGESTTVDLEYWNDFGNDYYGEVTLTRTK